MDEVLEVTMEREPGIFLALQKVSNLHFALAVGFASCLLYVTLVLSNFVLSTVCPPVLDKPPVVRWFEGFCRQQRNTIEK